MRIPSLQEILGPKEVERRRFGVEGEIVFVFKHAREVHIISDLVLPNLRQQIVEVDQEFPWKENVCMPDQTVPDLRRYLGHGVIRHRNDGNFDNLLLSPGQHIAFSIIPHYNCLRKTQLYAYEKYLEKLAEELAKRKLLGVDSVRSIFKVDSSRTFKS